MNLSITSSDAAKRDARRYFVSFALVVVALSALTMWLVVPIAPQFTGNASFDQKLMHVRAMAPDAGRPLSFIIGSSMALNNVDSDLLAAAYHKPFLNLGVWGMGPGDAQALADEVATRHAVGEVILTTQFFELRDEPLTAFRVNQEAFDQYMQAPFLLAGLAYRDFYDSLRMRQRWKKQSGNPQSYVNLLFTPTGAVHLNVPRDRIDQTRWNPVQDFPQSCANCTDEVETVCQTWHARDVDFTVIMPPLTHWVREARADVAALYSDRRARLKVSLAQCNAAFFDAEEWADFDDSCFVDFAHLNGEGARYLTGLFVDWRAANGSIARQKFVCGAAAS